MCPGGLDAGGCGEPAKAAGGRVPVHRGAAGVEQVRADRDAGYDWLATHDEDWRRALDVQGSLWRGGRIRAVGLPDLLIAAVAERERVTVLHYDGDYELIAQITVQPAQWVVPRGTVS